VERLLENQGAIFSNSVWFRQPKFAECYAKIGLSGVAHSAGECALARGKTQSGEWRSETEAAATVVQFLPMTAGLRHACLTYRKIEHAAACITIT
jgi:hypothetical protein